MNFKKIMHVFFTLMSLTTIAGFLYDPSSISLFIAASVNVISTLLRIGVNNVLSAELFSGSLVADLHLIPAFIAFEIYHLFEMTMALVIGALLANIFTTCLIMIEAAKSKHSEYDEEY